MEKLFTEFTATDANAWKARLEKDLKGITFEQLSGSDRNGITIHPFYTAQDHTDGAPVTTQADWSIVSTIQVSDVATANKKALHELNNGASGLHFVIDEDVDVASLLQDIELPYIYSLFQIGERAANFSNALHTYCEAKGWNIAEMDCFVEQDSIASYLSGASANKSINSHATIAVNAGIYLNAGANSSYELACTLAHVNEYLHQAKENNALSAINSIHISTTTDTAFFEQIAKLRALRTLLALVLEQYNITPKIHVHVTTSNTYRSPFDSYSNLLRDSVAGMAAVIGGCDSLYIPPFDAAVKDENEFSSRMSRNQQLIFKEESYFNKVADAAAGSYYIETLTEQIATQAWQHFQAIEQAGGLISAFEKGIIQKEIETQAQQLIQEYKDGKRVLIGVNKFVNATDEPKPFTAEKLKEKGLQAISLANEIL